MRLRLAGALAVEAKEPVEHHRAPGGREHDVPARRGELRLDPLEAGRGHLARQGAVADEGVEPCLVALEPPLEALGRAGEVRRPDRLMRLLHVARARTVDTRIAGQVRLSEVLQHDSPRRAERRLRQRHAVGAHVGDEPCVLAAEVDALVERLGERHRALDAEAEPARRLLLHRRGGERRVGTPAHRRARHRGDREAGLADPPHRRLRPRPGLEPGPVERRFVEAHRPGGQRAAARARRHVGLHRPVRARRERLDLRLALAHEPQRHRLHPPGRAAPRHLAPQHRREPEPHQVVERPARLLRAHQIHVDAARARHRLAHRLARDLVERDAAHRTVPERVALAQPAQHLPRDRLALAVGVRGKDETLGLDERRPDDAERTCRAPPGRLVDHREAVVGPHRARPRRQVAHQAVAGKDPVAAPEVRADRPRLGRRFDDNDPHGATSRGSRGRSRSPRRDRLMESGSAMRHARPAPASDGVRRRRHGRAGAVPDRGRGR